MSESRTGKVIKNSWYGLANKLITLLFSFWVRTIFIKTLGAEYLGVEGLFSNILSLLSLAELGVGNVLTFSLYKPIANKDTNKINTLLAFYKKVYLLIALFVAVFGVISIPILKYIVNSSFQSNDIIKFYLLYLSNSVLSYIAVYYTTLIRAEQEQFIIDIISCLTRIIASVFQIVVLLMFKNFVLFLLIAIISTLCQNIFASIVARKRYGIKKGTDIISQEEKRNIFNNVKSTFIYKIGVVIINATDNILISLFVGTVFVGYYSNYTLIVNQVNSLVAILCTALIASVGNLSANSDIEKSFTVFNRLIYFFHFFSCLCFVGFTLLFNDVITLWVGAENTLGMDVCFAVAFSFYIQNIINPIWMYREAYGLFSQIKYLMLVTSAFNIMLSILGVKILGISGIIIATGISRLLTTVWYEPKILYSRVFKKSTFIYFRKQGKHVFVTLFTFCVSYILFKTIHFELSFITTILKILIVIIIAALNFVVFNLKTDELGYWLQFVKKIVLRIIKKGGMIHGK